MTVKSTKKAILEALAHGKPIQEILKGLEEEADWNKVVEWLKEDESFRNDYEHAMKYGAVYLADDMIVLKAKVVSDPKNASAYKVAMDMIKWATMIRDPKYSERTIQEVKNTTPVDPDVVMAKIASLQAELGVTVVDVEAKLVHTPVVNVDAEAKKKARSERMRAIANRRWGNADASTEDAFGGSQAGVNDANSCTDVAEAGRTEAADEGL